MLWSAILFGLLGSFHCLGMCGPIALMLPIDRRNKVKGFFQMMSYHFGRLISYSIIGLLFGILGTGFHLLGFQQQISILMGTVMILLIIFPKLGKKNILNKKISSLVLRVKSRLGKELQKKQNDTFFLLGFFNGFLPCGLVYMAVLGALTSTKIITSVNYMFLFGLGTIPLLSALLFIGNFAKGNFRNFINKSIPVFVVIIGVLFIFRGLGLDIPYLSPNPVIETTMNSVKSCH